MDPLHAGRVEKNKLKQKKGFKVADNDNPMYNIKKIFGQIERMKQQEQQIKDRGFA